MTTLTGGYNVDMRTISSAGEAQIEAGQLISFSDTEVVIQTYDQFGDVLINIYAGTGFAEPNETGFPTTGIITSYTAQVFGQTAFTLTGTPTTVEDLRTAAAAGVDAYNQFLFGGDDTLTGANLDGGGDVLFGYGGDDVINGLAGADWLVGGDGHDTIKGGAGNDHLWGSLYGEASATFLLGTHPDDGVRDNLSGGDGDDTITAGVLDNAAGGTGTDTLDVTLAGLNHGVTLDLTGANLWSVLAAAMGGNLSGFEVLDALHTTEFDDVVSVSGAVNLYTQGGADTVNGGAGAQVIDAGSGADVVHGGAGGDSISGGVGADSLFGDDGADVVNGGAGPDHLDGGAGIDTVSYADSPAGVSIVLKDVVSVSGHSISGKGTGGTAQGDALVGFEHYLGSDLNDTMTAVGTWSGALPQITFDGGAGNDQLHGSANADVLMGGVGDDVLTGGAGADALYGGGGADHFVFESVTDSSPTARDVIYDFNPGEGDVIDLRPIDARPAVDGNQAFILVGAFDGHIGEARVSYSASDNSTTLALDVDGDKHADFALSILGNVTTGWLL